MKNKNTLGFTLIELLTVIMIIGILASVILVSMDTARKRAADTTIQNQMGQLRSLAEALYTFEKHYEDFYTVSLEASNTGDGLKFNRVRDEINRISGGTFTVKFPADNYREYCMYAPLVRESGVFCVDSTGDAAIVDTGTNCDSNIMCRAGSGGGSTPPPSCGTGGAACESTSDCCTGYYCDEGTEVCTLL